jgi:hypothetical protein
MLNPGHIRIAQRSALQSQERAVGRKPVFRCEGS